MLPDATERASSRHRLDRAWQAFVAGGPLEGVRPEIARSWQRCRERWHVDPALPRPPALPGEEIERRRERDEAFALAAPVLREFSGQLGESGEAIAWVDAEGWMLSIDGDRQVVEQLARIGFAPGGNWQEHAAGTSGIGSAFEERRPFEVFASEHYVEAWQGWVTVGAPVLAPVGREPIAVVAIAAPWDRRDPQSLLAASAIAALVDERLRAVQALRDEVLRYALRTAREAGDAVVAVGLRGQVLGTNDAGRDLLAAGGELPGTVREALLPALRARAAADGELALDWPGPGDRRRMACTVVRHDRRAVGAVLRVRPAVSAQRSPRGPSRQATRYRFEDILGDSDRLRAALDLARVASRNDLPVVLQGESGTGKELFAQAIHAASDRGDGPFVALNSGAIPPSLLESELFGYEPGTFTGGQREGRAGKLEEADGGTLFLDEVSELSPQAQTALLRVLQESEVVRIGGAPRRVDVRVVAATNRRLADEVVARRFRQDLFFRLDVLSITIPALRDRGDDVRLLAQAFLGEAERQMGRSGLALSPAALEALAAHGWPGNVRELRNVILRAAATARGPAIDPGDLLLVQLQPGAAGAGRAEGDAEAHAAASEADGPERDELVAALDACGWNIARTATTLGVSRMTLYRRLRRFGITR